MYKCNSLPSLPLFAYLFLSVSPNIFLLHVSVFVYKIEWTLYFPSQNSILREFHILCTTTLTSFLSFSNFSLTLAKNTNAGVFYFLTC